MDAVLDHVMNRSTGTETALCGALGEAVVRFWSHLPQSVQQGLFNHAVTSHGEPMRQPLAVFLHHNHSRTADAMKAHAMREPDSLGG